MDGVDITAAWSEFCDRLKTVGETIAGDGFPASRDERAQGYRYLAGLTGHALEWFIDRADTEFPAFVRSESDVVRWGGPNPDNDYRRAHVDPSSTYRITANVAGVRQLIISTHEGDMQLGRPTVFEERNLSELEVGADGSLEIVLSPEAHPGNWIPLDGRADHVLVRQYVSDWDRDAVAHLDITCVGFEGAEPPRLTDERIARGLRDAADWVEATATYWNDYTAALCQFSPANTVSPPSHPPGGARDIAYGGGWYDLAPGRALIFEAEPPAAEYWSVQLLTLGWMESYDARRLSSLSGDQIRVDDDGRCRVVVAHDDPGVPNWLDTEGLAVGLITYRWVFASTFPSPTATVVPLEAIRDHLPPSTPAFTRGDRREQLARRQRAVARRFR